MKIFGIAFIGLGLITLPIACGSSSETNNIMTNSAKPAPKMATVLIPAIMTNEGVECPAVRGNDNTLYTIPDLPSDIKIGDSINIEVRNPIVNVASFCQQGQTLDWIRIELLSQTKEVVKHWTK